MVFPTPQIYFHYSYRYSFFLSQQLNINKIGLFESFTQPIIYQTITLLLCFKTHLTMLSFFLNIAFFRLLLLQIPSIRVFLSHCTVFTSACTNFR